jgi:hypothetical protein
MWNQQIYTTESLTIDSEVGYSFYGTIEDVQYGAGATIKMMVRSYVSTERLNDIVKSELEPTIIEHIGNDMDFEVGDRVSLHYELKIVNGKPSLILESVGKVSG